MKVIVGGVCVLVGGVVLGIGGCFRRSFRRRCRWCRVDGNVIVAVEVVDGGVIVAVVVGIFVRVGVILVVTSLLMPSRWR